MRLVRLGGNLRNSLGNFSLHSSSVAHSKATGNYGRYYMFILSCQPHLSNITMRKQVLLCYLVQWWMVLYKKAAVFTLSTDELETHDYQPLVHVPGSHQDRTQVSWIGARPIRSRLVGGIRMCWGSRMVIACLLSI